VRDKGAFPEETDAWAEELSPLSSRSRIKARPPIPNIGQSGKESGLNGTKLIANP
jgi:hypothetical protein